MIRFILTDIEGTTSSIDFVHQVLFPYSARYLDTYIAEHNSEPEVQACLAGVRETLRAEGQTDPDATDELEALHRWINEDRKHPALKKLQGYIWKEGYELGRYKGHVYPDVPLALAAWKQAGITMGVYSSGSVEAQKLIFGFSDFGDLTPYFSFYFDTTVGHKREVGSYTNILKQIGSPGTETLFLSDVEQELDAAKEAGMHTCQLVRGNTVPSQKHPLAHSFDEISLD